MNHQHWIEWTTQKGEIIVIRGEDVGKKERLHYWWQCKWGKDCGKTEEELKDNLLYKEVTIQDE